MSQSILSSKIKHITKKIFSNYFKLRKYGHIQNIPLTSLQADKQIEPELLLLENFIKKGDCCFDIGANAGQYTFMLEKHAGSENIFSFEPIPENYASLNSIFKHCNVYSLAISDKNGKNNFKIPIINKTLFDTRGKLDLDFLEENETSSKIIEVETITIDSFVKLKNIKKISFIKIDVEGHELNVLKGGVNSIKKFKPVLLIEIERRHHKFEIQVIFDFLKKLGYQIEFYDLVDHKFKSIVGLDLNEAQNIEAIKTSSYINNFFCIPRKVQL